MGYIVFISIFFPVAMVLMWVGEKFLIEPSANEERVG
jgi:hypothetical protein